MPKIPEPQFHDIIFKNNTLWRRSRSTNSRKPALTYLRGGNDALSRRPKAEISEMAFLNLSNPLTRPSSSRAAVTFPQTALQTASPLPAVMSNNNHTLSFNVNAPLLVCRVSFRFGDTIRSREFLR